MGELNLGLILGVQADVLELEVHGRLVVLLDGLKDMNELIGLVFESPEAAGAKNVQLRCETAVVM